MVRLFYEWWWGIKMLRIETFENEELEYNFTGDWERTTQRAYEGTHSFASKKIGHSQQTNAYLTITTDYIEFYWYVSSENSYDWFEFYIGETRELRQSGTRGWNKFSKELTKSQYTFRWRYYKDGSSSSGDDKAYIDNLVINVPENRYFIADEGVLKTWSIDTEKYIPVTILNVENGEMSYLTPADLSEAIFLEHGMEDLVVSKKGLVDTKSKIYYFTDDEIVVNDPSSYELKLTETVTSLPKVVTEKEGRTLQDNIRLIAVEDITTGLGDIRYALSKDKESWYAFDINNMQWQLVDTTSDTDFSIKGMRKTDFMVIREEHYQEIFKVEDRLYFAFRFYKGELTDECKFKSIKINYTSSVDSNI